MPNALANPAMAAAPPGAAEPPQKTTTLPEVKAAIKKQAAIDSKMRGLLRGGKPVERNKAVDMCISLVAEGVFSAEQMAGYLMTLPTDPMKVREWIEGHAKKVEANMDQMIEMIHGQEALADEPMAAAPDTMPTPEAAPPDPNAMAV